MRFTKRRPIILSAWIAVVLLSAIAFHGTSAIAADRTQDLHALQEAASTQSYPALIKAVQAKQVPPEGFVFVVLGDSRDNMHVAERVYQQAASEKPMFIIHTGDVTKHGTTAEYLQYHLPLVELIAPLPLIPVPGNHEKGPEKDFAGFKTIYGADRFSFTYGGCRFVGANNGGRDRLSDADLKYLDEQLSIPEPSIKFVFLHVPPTFVEQATSKGKGASGYHGFTSNADAFRDLIKQKKVQAAFFGHDHGFATCMMDGVHYTITGGGGAPLHERMDWLLPEYHYVVIRVTAKGFSQELVRLEGDNWVRSKL